MELRLTVVAAVTGDVSPAESRVSTVTRVEQAPTSSRWGGGAVKASRAGGPAPTLTSPVPEVRLAAAAVTVKRPAAVAERKKPAELAPAATVTVLTALVHAASE